MIQRFNDATDRQHAPFPTIQIQPVASGFASPVTVTNAADGSGRLFIVESSAGSKFLLMQDVENRTAR
jgi:hypothetical protein